METYTASHYPSLARREIANALHIKMPPKQLTQAKTPGGCYRRLYAMYRREIDLGVIGGINIAREGG